MQKDSLRWRLNEIIKAKGWTRHRLSKESGVPASTIYRILENDVDVSFKNLQKIANALGTADFIPKGKPPLQRRL